MDLFSTNALIGVVRTIIPAPRFLRDMFFPVSQTEDTEEIHFDVITGRRRLAPFVSPFVEGKVMTSLGHETKTFKPAYIKDKRVFKPNRPLKRLPGEPLGGNLSPEQRRAKLIGQDLLDMLDNIGRRLEWMAAQILAAGAVTISGENYPPVLVDFSRDASLTVDITGGGGTNEWGDEGVKPLNDLQDWALLALKLSGVKPTEVIMDVDTWKIFREDAQVEKRLDLRRVTQEAMRLDAAVMEGGSYMGTIDGFNIWVYEGWYEDENTGVLTRYIPQYTVIMAAPGQAGLGGVEAYGAILDEDAGIQAMQFFPKSWVKKDPSVRYLMGQSAPLMVPTRVNASLKATVKAASE